MEEGENAKEEAPARLRNEVLNGEISYGLAEAHTVIEGWRGHDNTQARTRAGLPSACSSRRAMVGCTNPTRFAGYLKRRRQAHCVVGLNRATWWGQAGSAAHRSRPADGPPRRAVRGHAA